MGHSSLERLSNISRGWGMLGVDLPSKKPTAFPGRGDWMDAAEPQQGKPWQYLGHHPQEGPKTPTGTAHGWGTFPKVQGRAISAGNSAANTLRNPGVLPNQ